MTMANLIGSFLFGAIGFVAFVYGKRMQLWKTLGIGLVLMVFPYFVSHTGALYVIGTALTVALVLVRD